MKFEEAVLGDYCEILSSKRIYAKEYQQCGIPFYRSKEIIQKANNNLVTTELFISKERFEEIRKKFGIPTEGDILLTSVGTLGVPYLVQNEEFYFKDGNLTRFTNFSTHLNNEYLYYWFSSKLGKNEIDRITIGSTQKALTIVNLKSLKISLPPVNIQMKIVSILKSIDEKLKSNLKQIAIMEQLSQTLFKHWFNDFEFPNEQGHPYKSSGGEMVESELGEIPTGWQVKCLEDVFSLKRGYDLPVSKREDGLIPILSSSGVNGYHNVAKVHGPGVITGRSGKLGNVFYIEEDYWPLNTALYVEDFKNSNPIYIYFLMKNLDFESLNAGSSVPTLNRNHVHKLKIVSPKKELVEKFGTLVDPIFEKKDSLRKEIEALNKIRDILLPKLLSGEIKISGDLEVD
ncbi:hypothetical protein CN507_20245 [Bacillus cereus]|nr:hypothetical protein CN507_20245 [Bacillus cereus]